VVLLQDVQSPFIVDQPLPQCLLVVGIHANLVVADRPLATQPEPDADVIGEADLLALRAGDQLVALGVVDTKVMVADGIPSPLFKAVTRSHYSVLQTLFAPGTRSVPCFAAVVPTRCATSCGRSGRS
jgi:hypothetical protein